MLGPSSSSLHFPSSPALSSFSLSSSSSVEQHLLPAAQHSEVGKASKMKKKKYDKGERKRHRKREERRKNYQEEEDEVEEDIYREEQRGVRALLRKGDDKVDEEEEREESTLGEQSQGEKEEEKDTTAAEARRGPVRLCRFEGCPKWPRGRSGLCVRHGGKGNKKCSHSGCTAQVRRGGVCVQHGAAKQQCEVEGCGRTMFSKKLCYAHFRLSLSSPSLSPTVLSSPTFLSDEASSSSALLPPSPPSRASLLPQSSLTKGRKKRKREEKTITQERVTSSSTKKKIREKGKDKRTKKEEEKSKDNLLYGLVVEERDRAGDGKEEIEAFSLAGKQQREEKQRLERQKFMENAYRLSPRSLLDEDTKAALEVILNSPQERDAKKKRETEGETVASHFSFEVDGKLEAFLSSSTKAREDRQGLRVKEEREREPKRKSLSSSLALSSFAPQSAPLIGNLSLSSGLGTPLAPPSFSPSSSFSFPLASAGYPSSSTSFPSTSSTFLSLGPVSVSQFSVGGHGEPAWKGADSLLSSSSSALSLSSSSPSFFAPVLLSHRNRRAAPAVEAEENPRPGKEDTAPIVGAKVKEKSPSLPEEEALPPSSFLFSPLPSPSQHYLASLLPSAAFPTAALSPSLFPFPAVPSPPPGASFSPRSLLPFDSLSPFPATLSSSVDCSRVPALSTALTQGPGATEVKPSSHKKKRKRKLKKKKQDK